MSIKSKKYDAIILTYSPKNELLLSIDKLVNQTIIPSKIIIYNTDKEAFYKNIFDKEKLRKYIENRYNTGVEFVLQNIEKKDFDHGKTRNDATKFSNAEYILFMTDDAVPADENMAANLLYTFSNYDIADHKVAVSYARQVAKKNAKLKEKYVREFNYPNYDIVKEKSKEFELGIKNYFCSNVCAMYDREIFDELNGFEEKLILNEDTFYVYNAINKGYRVVYSAYATVYHSHNLTYKEQFNRNFDIGVSQCQKKDIFKNIPSTKEGLKFTICIFFKLLFHFHPCMAFDFAIECIYRYLGFRKGINYENLTKEECIKYANNKNYFINKDF